MSTLDQEYFARRAQQERDTAERCDDHGARRIHLELAARYASLAREPLMARPVQL